MKFAIWAAAMGAMMCVAAPSRAAPAPTSADADAFLAGVEQEYADFLPFLAKIRWIEATYITDDTDAVAARVGAEATEMQVRFAKGATSFDDVAGMDADTRRKLDGLKLGLVMPAPDTPGAAAELAMITTRIRSEYGKGRGTLRGREIGGSDIETAMGQNRNPAELTEMWVSWHDNVGKPMRQDYARMVAIADKGAVGLGFADVGAMWRSGYDMPPQDFSKMMDRLWERVKPLYVALHCYTRTRLNARYGDAVQPKTGPIRADLLGDMWAQEWGNIYDIVAPPGAGNIGYDVGRLLAAKNYDARRMVRTAEGFYSSLGFAPLPDSFWARSQFVKPRDREVICHASAWDIDSKDDVRIKACLKVNSDDFVTIHHELGHNYYQRAYRQQPIFYRDGANDGFHEAIGDFVALSITPEYLVRIGLLDKTKVPGADKDIGLLLRQAMDKVASLPFGLLMDKWRWGVFDGSIPAAHYQKAWDELRLRYQGVVPPVDRDESAFDPGAKYHIPANTPYARYFLARILQFQFYRAACEQSGWQGPLHRCSFYGDKDVGNKLNAMLEMGSSKPWPDALEKFTGGREIDGSAMMEYFRPLTGWLDQQNKGAMCGW